MNTKNFIILFSKLIHTVLLRRLCTASGLKAQVVRFLILAVLLLNSSFCYAEKILPLRYPNNVISNTNFYFIQGGGVSFTYDYAVTENIQPGFGIGLTAGRAYFQYILPIFINFYPISSKDYNHRMLFVTSADPLYEYDPKRNYGAISVGAAVGYEYKNDAGTLLYRMTAGFLVPLANHHVGQSVLIHLRFGIGFSV